jgi:hypothetical protein
MRRLRTESPFQQDLKPSSVISFNTFLKICNKNFKFFLHRATRFLPPHPIHPPPSTQNSHNTHLEKPPQANQHITHRTDYLYTPNMSSLSQTTNRKELVDSHFSSTFNRPTHTADPTCVRQRNNYTTQNQNHQYCHPTNNIFHIQQEMLLCFIDLQGTDPTPMFFSPHDTTGC